MRAKKPKINFIVLEERWSILLPNWKEDFSNALEKIAEFLKKDFSKQEVSVVLTNDKEMKAMNKTFRNLDKPTNVLSFPTEVTGELGDIILGFETILNEAKEAHISLQHHTTHMIVHGFLHLLGYDHQTNEEANNMETTEITILNSLNIKNPYEDL